MSAYNKLRKNVILLCCCILVVIVAFVCVLTFLSDRRKKNREAAENITIATVGDVKISEKMFKFYARVLLQTEDGATAKTLYSSTQLSDQDELKKYTLDFTREYIISKQEAGAAGVTLTDEELAQLNQQFESDYEAAKTVDGKTLEKDEFYIYYHGITEEEYKDFWKNWYLISKYTKIQEQKADVSEETQKMAFTEYYDYLYCYNTSVIPLYVNTTNTKEAQIEKANTILTSLTQGSDFGELLRQNCTDEDLLQKNGEMKFYPVNKFEFSEVYDWLRSSDVGSAGVVQTDTVIYVIRLNSITDFEQLKNTDTMLQWTRTFGVNRDLSALLSSDQYPLKVIDSVYDKCDLSVILKEAYEFWKNSLEHDIK